MFKKDNRVNLVEETKKAILNEDNANKYLKPELKEALDDIASEMELEVEIAKIHDILGGYANEEAYYIPIQIDDYKYAVDYIKSIGYKYKEVWQTDDKHYSKGNITVIFTMRYENNKFVGYNITAV